jgi:hypothetical protein
MFKPVNISAGGTRDFWAGSILWEWRDALLTRSADREGGCHKVVRLREPFFLSICCHILRKEAALDHPYWRRARQSPQLWRGTVASWVQHVEPADCDHSHRLTCACCDAPGSAEIRAGDWPLTVRVIDLAFEHLRDTRQRPDVHLNEKHAVPEQRVIVSAVWAGKRPSRCKGVG